MFNEHVWGNHVIPTPKSYTTEDQEKVLHN